MPDFIGCGRREPDFYVAASLGRADENPSSDGADVGNSEGTIHVEPVSMDVDTGDLAWSVALGYRVNRYLAAEVEYIDFGTTDVVEHYQWDTPGGQLPFPIVASTGYSSHVTGPALSLLGTLPVGGNFELFLRGGALFASREIQGAESFSSTVWQAGAGVTFSFANHWSIRAEYQQTGELSSSFPGDTSLKKISLTALVNLGN